MVQNKNSNTKEGSNKENEQKKKISNVQKTNSKIK